jgi:Big-like domain-containing protein
MRQAVLLAALVGVCGSSSSFSSNPVQGVTLHVSPGTVAAGAAVTLTLRNNTTVAVSYNLCSSRLERRGDGGWETVPEDRACTQELRILKPGATDRFTVRLAPGLPAGEYRFQTSVGLGDGGAGRNLRTPAFRVT